MADIVNDFLNYRDPILSDTCLVAVPSTKILPNEPDSTPLTESKPSYSNASELAADMLNQLIAQNYFDLMEAAAIEYYKAMIYGAALFYFGYNQEMGKTALLSGLKDYLSKRPYVQPGNTTPPYVPTPVSIRVISTNPAIPDKSAVITFANAYCAHLQNWASERRVAVNETICLLPVNKAAEDAIFNLVQAVNKWESSPYLLGVMVGLGCDFSRGMCGTTARPPTYFEPPTQSTPSWGGYSPTSGGSGIGTPPPAITPPDYTKISPPVTPIVTLRIPEN